MNNEPCDFNTTHKNHEMLKSIVDKKNTPLEQKQNSTLHQTLPTTIAQYCTRQTKTCP